MAYKANVFSILEYGCQVWGPMLSGVQSSELESVQSHALQIIGGANSGSYRSNLLALELPKLCDRRKEITDRFAIKTYLNPRHRWWFKPSPHPTRGTIIFKIGPV